MTDSPPIRPETTWTRHPGYEDVIYETSSDGIARITINRPEVRNAFRPQTTTEMIRAFDHVRDDASVGVVILTGAGNDAFCSGGDQRVRGSGGYVGDDGVPRLNVLDLHMRIRYLPKPVVAMVAGYAIGGGHVLHLVCDLTIAADNARFGQTGPKVGSFDAGFGSSYMARVVGQKKAREIWFLCRQYDATQALDMGLVNTVVPRDARAVADRAAVHQAGDERRLRWPGRHDGVRRLGDAHVLHHRRGPRGQGSLPREAQARLLAVQALPVSRCSPVATPPQP